MKKLKNNFVIRGILSALFVVFIIIVGFFAYAFVRFNDPNYIEFGPMIYFYPSKECAFTTNSCQKYWGQSVTGIFKNTPPTLSEGLKRLLVRAKDHPQDPNSWQCMTEERIVEDKNEKLWIQEGKLTIYKCWPK